MNREAMTEWLLKEITVAVCWIIVLVGALVIAVRQGLRDPTFHEPLTWIVTAAVLLVSAAAWFTSARRQRKLKRLRAEHKDLLP
jgi:hypothetical protein